MSKEPRKLKQYTYYRFTTYDPVIAKTIALIDDRISAGGAQKSYSSFAKDANVSPSTIRNWKTRKTRRPLFSTVAGCWGAAGRKTIDIS